MYLFVIHQAFIWTIGLSMNKARVLLLPPAPLSSMKPKVNSQKKPTDVVWLSLHAANYLPARVWENRFFCPRPKKLIFDSIFVQKSDLHVV